MTRFAERPALAQPAESRWVPQQQQQRDRASGKHFPHSSSASRRIAGAAGFVASTATATCPTAAQRLARSKAQMAGGFLGWEIAVPAIGDVG